MTPLRYSWMIAVYAIIPLSLLAIALDLALYSGALRRALPHIPDVLLWYQLLFNLPHIIASFFPYASRSAIGQYGRRIALASLVILATSAVLLSYAPSLAFLVLAVWTVAHVVLQQTGLSRMMVGVEGKTYRVWRGAIILLGTLVFIAVYPSSLHSEVMGALTPALIVLVPIVVLASVRYARKAKEKKASYYALATGGIVLASALAFMLGYYAIAIIVPRVIHDLTAYLFYLTHGMNSVREGSSSDSYLASLGLGRIGVSVLIVLTSVALAYPLTHGLLGAATTLVVFFVSFLHYYLDGFAWKRGSVLRRDIAFQYS